MDQGTTQTDSMALERRRGITIRAAVVAFTVDDVTINLIDTPGHPDFIAEVDRSLHVLDGAVLVISAVEGVQSQTVVLMRALHRLRVPTLIFVNKIDRTGADPERVLEMIRDRLVPPPATQRISAQGQPILMGLGQNTGNRTAGFLPYGPPDREYPAVLTEALADNDEKLLARIVDGRAPSADELRRALLAQTITGEIHPVFLGSAATGAGISELMVAITTLLPAAEGAPDAPVAGSVFKVDPGRGGEKAAYVRMFTGTIGVRQRLRFGAGREAIVTGVKVFEHGTTRDTAAVSAGQIAKLTGLSGVRVGDQVGARVGDRVANAFAPPTMETAVVARRPAQKAALYAALTELAEQDPLIDLRQDDMRQQLFVSLYGEVQKEVIGQTLTADFGIDVEFRETSILCIERPVGVGRAVERLGRSTNPFIATVGLTVEPGPPGAGLEFRLAVELISVPLYVYKTVDAFRTSMAEYVQDTLQQGLFGWQVRDVVVTLTDSGYSSPSTTSGDFRKLTPLLVMEALAQAGTVVCEPIHHFHLEAPADTLSVVFGMLARYQAVPQVPTVSGSWFWVDGDVPAAQVHQLQRHLQANTHGEGVLEVHFDRYETGTGRPAQRPRSGLDPLNGKEYLLHVLRRF